MAIVVKIAPDLDEIKREGNVFECDFNKMHIKWVIAMDCKELGISDEITLKKWLQNAIGMSGKMWQVPYALNKGLLFPSEVYVNDKKVEYPKD
jgi:hypothetical protein